MGLSAFPLPLLPCLSIVIILSAHLLQPPLDVNHSSDYPPASATASEQAWSNDHRPDSIGDRDPIAIIPTTARLNLGGWIAWAVIVLLMLTMMLLNGVPKIFQPDQTSPQAISAAEMTQLELQGKNLLYQKSLQGQLKKVDPAEPGPTIPDHLDERTLTQRRCVSIMIAELHGPAQGLEHLELTQVRLQQTELTPTENQKRVTELVTQILSTREQGQYSFDSLPEDDVRFLREELGWFAELLMTPESEEGPRRKDLIDSATSTFYKSILAFVIGGGLLLLGVAFFIGGIVLLFLRKIQSQFSSRPDRHNLYVQTFAIWLVIFFGGQILLGVLLNLIGAREGIGPLAWSLIPFFGSLICLAWPVINGVSFAQVREDIGWKRGNPIVETLLGIPAYLALLPFLIAAAILVVVLTFLTSQSNPLDFSSEQGGSHPIQEFLKAGDVTTIIVVLLTACVAAPLVEETMFRGVLYRHLRDVSIGSSRWFSIAFACLINSFIFAAIHPQGLIGIPLLGTLAIGFSLTREVRGSLIAPIIMHGLNNLLVTGVMLWYFR